MCCNILWYVDYFHDYILSFRTNDHFPAVTETEVPKAQTKAPAKRAAAQKKALPSTPDVSDGEDAIEIDDDEFEPAAAVGGKKKGGRKPAAAKAAAAPKPPGKKAPANNQSQSVGQRLITQVLKPAEDAGVSPDRKVRKMRASPFNKKSGAVMGKNTSSSSTSSHESEEVSPLIPSLGSLDEEVSEVVVAPKARPQRATKKTTTYVISDSDTEEDNDDIEISDDDIEPSDDTDSDFE